MKQQHDLYNLILEKGRLRENRTGIDTIGIFGHMSRYDLSESFPLPTTRKLFTRGMFEELFWFLSGDTNIAYLKEKDVKFWDEWALTGKEVVAHANLSIPELEYMVAEHMGLVFNQQSYEEAGITVEDIHKAVMEWAETVADTVAEESKANLNNPQWCLHLYGARNDFTMVRPVTLDWFTENATVMDLVELAKALQADGRAKDPEDAQAIITNELLSAIREHLLKAQAVKEEDITDELLMFQLNNLAEDQTVAIACSRLGYTYVNFRPEQKVGDLGPVYGKVWTDWNGINQIDALIDGIKTRPYSRRHIVSAWKVDLLPDESMSPQDNVIQGRQALAPCHTLFQFYVEDLTAMEKYDILKGLGNVGELYIKELVEQTAELSGEEEPIGKYLVVPEGRIYGKYLTKLMAPLVGHVEGIYVQRLSCLLYQRSADTVLGLPINVASYATLTHMVAQQCDMAVGEFIHAMGDAHIYVNQMDKLREQLAREIKPATAQLVIKRKPESIYDYNINDFEIVDYDPEPAIVFPRPAV